MASKIKIDIARKEITFCQCDERQPIYAPSWELVMAFKNKEIDWTEYTRRYIIEMRDAYREHSEIFKRDAKRLDNIEFYCWCMNFNFPTKECHRFLLRDILEKVRSNV